MRSIRNLFNRDESQSPLADRTEEILNRHLDRDFRVFPMADHSASIADVTSIAKRFGVTFPDDFCSHVCGRFPGIYIEVKEVIWPRPKLYHVGPFWSFLYGLHTFTPRGESDEWMRLDHVTQQFQETTGHKASPILRIIGDADVYCTTPEGQIARYNHETNEMESGTIGFWELFEREVQLLKERKVRKVSGV